MNNLALRRSTLIYLIALSLLVKLGTLMYDNILYPAPNFYLYSDSGTYLLSALKADNIPYDRPFGYSVFLRLVFTLAGSVNLRLVPVAQAVLGILTSLLIYAICLRHFKVHPLLAFGLAALSAVSPLTLLYERYILSESLSLFLMVAAVFLILELLATSSLMVANFLGLTLLALLLVRSCWVFMAPLAVLLVAFQAVRLSRLRPSRHYLALLVLVLSYYVPYRAYCQWYATSVSRDASLAGQGVTPWSGWVLWSKVACFAEPGDMSENWYKHLTSNPAALRSETSDDQLWNDRASTHRFRMAYCNGSIAHANRRLMQAARAVILHHPIAFIRMSLSNVPKYFSPKIHDDPSKHQYIDQKSDIAAIVRTHGNAEIALQPGQPFTPVWFLRGFLVGWTRLRPLFSVIFLAGLLAGLIFFRRAYGLLAVGAVAFGYFALTNITAIFLERYYQPLEFLALLSVAGLAGLAASFRRPRAAAPAAPAEEEAPVLTQDNALPVG